MMRFGNWRRRWLIQLCKKGTPYNLIKASTLLLDFGVLEFWIGREFVVVVFDNICMM